MVAQPEPLVTGDAVVLDVQIAQLPVRALSALIDVLVVGVLYLIGFTLWAITLLNFDDALSAAVLIIFTVLAFVGYPIIFETATRGRSLGKMALGLRVVSDDGGPERFRQALFRALAGFIEIWTFFGGPAVICSMLSARGKRIGDVFAGTMVISERGPKMSPPVPMPPALAAWASSLQLSGLRPEQAELARQFLSRAAQLEPRIRDQMAYRIYGDVISQISPPPPPDAPPPLVLAAVLAERHRRERVRLQPSAAQFPTPPLVAAPVWPQPQAAYPPQPGFGQPAYAQPGYAQPRYPQQPHPQPTYQQPEPERSPYARPVNPPPDYSPAPSAPGPSEPTDAPSDGFTPPD